MIWPFTFDKLNKDLRSSGDQILTILLVKTKEFWPLLDFFPFEISFKIF